MDIFVTHATNVDLCIYMCHEGHKVVFILLYVDDCTIIVSCGLLQVAKDTLSTHFPIKDLGEATLVLGIEIIRDHVCGAIDLRQAGHIQTILTQFAMSDCKPQPTPRVSDLALTKLAAMAPEHAHLPYQQAVGMPQNLSQATQPNIAYAVNYLCKFAAGFNEAHWPAVKHYRQGMKNHTIHYQCLINPLQLHLHPQGLVQL